MSDISATIARLRRSQPRNPDTLAVCAELEARIIAENKPKPLATAKDNPRTAYQRQYMRDMRAAKKLGLTTEEYRAKKHAYPVDTYRPPC